MRSLTLVLAFCASGCYCSHVRMPVDAGVPLADTGAPDAALLADGGTDAGSDAGADAGLPDAGVCIDPLLVIEHGDPLRCGDLLLGDPDRQAMILVMQNYASRAMRVVQWRFGFVHDPADCALTTIRHVRLQDPASGASYGQSVLTSGPGDTGNFEAFIHPTDLVIAPGATSVSVRLDIAAYIDGGCPGYSAIFTSYSRDPFMDIEVVWDDDGAPLPADDVCFSPDVLNTGGWIYRANLSVWTRDDDTRTLIAAGEQQIGRIFIRNVDNAGIYSATVETMRLGFGGVFSGDDRPRTLRVYHDAVAPENLVASTTFADGRPIETWWPNEEFTDVDIASGINREFLVTLDSDGVSHGSTLSVSLEGMYWSDGVVHTTRLGCGFPVGGRTITFVSPP